MREKYTKIRNLLSVRLLHPLLDIQMHLFAVTNNHNLDVLKTDFKEEMNTN